MKKRYGLWTAIMAFYIFALAGCSRMDTEMQPESSATSEEEQSDQDGDSLVWLIDNKKLAQRLQKPLNELLKEKGVSYTVSVIGEETDIESDGKYIDILKDRKAENEPTDVIYIPETKIIGDSYGDAVREGILMPLKTQEGENSVSETLGEFAMESMKVGWTLYGLKGLPVYYETGLAFNTYYLDKYQISTDSLSGDLFQNEELYRKISEMDEEVNTPLAYWALTEEEMGYGFLFPSCAVGFSSKGNGEIVNVFAQEEVREYLNALKNLRDQDLISFLNMDGFQAVEEENGYFSITHYVTNPQAESVRIEGFVDKDGKQIVTDAVFIPDHKDEQGLSIMPRGQLTGIASWSQRPEQAYEFLKLLYTDADVANLVKFGVEGEDYRVEDGRIAELSNPEIYPSVNASYINDMLTYPMEEEPDDKKENWDQYFASRGLHPLTGFQFDPSKVEDEINATNALIKESLTNLDSYTQEFKQLMSVDVADVGQALQSLNEKLQAAGIENIIEEANRQIQKWKAAKEG